MAFTPIIKVRNQKQQANAKRKAAKVTAKRLAKEAKISLKQRAEKPNGSDQLDSPQTALKAWHKQAMLNAVVEALDADATNSDNIRGSVCVQIGTQDIVLSKAILDTVKPLNLALIAIQQHATQETHTQEAGTEFASEIEDGRITITKETVPMAISQYANKSIDFAYIGAGNSYETTQKTLNVLFPKISDNGFIALDEYVSQPDKTKGTQSAINEFLGTHSTQFCVFKVEDTQIVLTKIGSVLDA